MRLRPAEQDRVAVRLGACDGGSAYRAAAATHVFNHHRTEQGLHLIRPRATDSVERTTRGKRNHEPDGPCRIGLRPCNEGYGRQRGSARGQMQEFAAGKFHGGPQFREGRTSYVQRAALKQEYADCQSTRKGRCRLVADIVAKVFLGCRTKILRTADAFYVQRREGPYRFIQNRPRTSVAALKSEAAAAEKPKDQVRRDFSGCSIF